MGHDRYTSVAMDRDGDFVVAWALQASRPRRLGFLHPGAPLLSLRPARRRRQRRDRAAHRRRPRAAPSVRVHGSPRSRVGAVDAAACRRCDEQQIGLHLTALDLALDVDGNGDPDPLTDGLPDLALPLRVPRLGLSPSARWAPIAFGARLRRSKSTWKVWGPDRLLSPTPRARVSRVLFQLAFPSTDPGGAPAVPHPTRTPAQSPA